MFYTILLFIKTQALFHVGTTTTTIVDPLTKGIKTEEENQGLNLKHKSETSDKSIGNDTNLLARRVRQIPAKGTKGNFHLVLEEIHELPPLIIKSSELRGRLEELNADYFDKLFSNPNPSILTTMRSSLANSFKGTKKSSKNCYQKILSFFRQKTPDTNQSKTNVKHQLYTKNGTKIIYN